MEITIQSLHFTPGKDLNEYIHDNVKKLARFYDRIESVNINLKIENAGITEQNVCEIRLAVPGNDLFAKKENKTFKEAISETLDALKQQIEKLKSKSVSHS